MLAVLFEEKNGRRSGRVSMWGGIMNHYETLFVRVFSFPGDSNLYSSPSPSIRGIGVRNNVPQQWGSCACAWLSTWGRPVAGWRREGIFPSQRFQKRKCDFKFSKLWEKFPQRGNFILPMGNLGARWPVKSVSVFCSVHAHLPQSIPPGRPGRSNLPQRTPSFMSPRPTLAGSAGP
ncbi:hypothetical protein J6590_064308 [Homalodisca vitripennis]|nr:hypothetical protein J6590_064308 [Homalodisca vitripennis]